MKTAIYIEDGIVQLILTAENEFERSAIATLMKEPSQAQIFEGSFYDCRGGWVKQSAFYPDRTWPSYDKRDTSIILRVGKSEDVRPDVTDSRDLGLTPS